MEADYQRIIERIHRLSAEQHQLYILASKRALTDNQRKRLGEIKEALKDMWLARKRLRYHFQDPLNKLIGQSYGRAT